MIGKKLQVYGTNENGLTGLAAEGRNLPSCSQVLEGVLDGELGWNEYYVTCEAMFLDLPHDAFFSDNFERVRPVVSRGGDRTDRGRNGYLVSKRQYDSIRKHSLSSTLPTNTVDLTFLKPDNPLWELLVPDSALSKEFHEERERREPGPIHHVFWGRNGPESYVDRGPMFHLFVVHPSSALLHTGSADKYTVLNV